MTPDELFEAALQLAGTPWRVVRSDFSGKPPVLEIVLEFSRGSQFHCPQCGQLCAVHDTTQKRWRHLNFFQILSAISQNQPVIIEIRGVKTSHFKESKTAPWDREKIGSLEHVECPQSEPANNDIRV